MRWELLSENVLSENKTMELSSIPVIFYLLLVKALCLVDAVTVHYLHWNTSNPIFRIDNTDHIVDVNQGNLPWEYDQLNIICPSYLGARGGTKTSEQDVPEQYIIYNVSREEYDSCRISQSDPRVVAVCDKPDKKLQFTITFRYSKSEATSWVTMEVDTGTCLQI